MDVANEADPAGAGERAWAASGGRGPPPPSFSRAAHERALRDELHIPGSVGDPSIHVIDGGATGDRFDRFAALGGPLARHHGDVAWNGPDGQAGEASTLANELQRATDLAQAEAMQSLEDLDLDSPPDSPFGSPIATGAGTRRVTVAAGTSLLTLHGILEAGDSTGVDTDRDRDPNPNAPIAQRHLPASVQRGGGRGGGSEGPGHSTDSADVSQFSLHPNGHPGGLRSRSVQDNPRLRDEVSDVSPSVNRAFYRLLVFVPLGP